jgi:hypothetical protein
LHYQAGKIILKTKMSFPKSALLSEFGWEPINEFLDRQRVNYFARFDEHPAEVQKIFILSKYACFPGEVLNVL